MFQAVTGLAGRRERRGGGVLPSPNIWNWPDLYEVENRAQDPDGVLWDALRAARDWSGADVVDVGCGAGFHLPVFARSAARVVGVEPHPPLAAAARQRVRDLPAVTVHEAGAQRLPLPDAAVDLVHARTAYFFGPGCEPGLVEADRVLRPGGTLAVVDLDATRHSYGRWMRADLPRYDPLAAERFFVERGFSCQRFDVDWRFDDRRSLESVLGIEFSPEIAARAAAEVPGLSFRVGYRVHVRHKPRGPVLPNGATARDDPR
ncbi:class I SAM-dependent methyltransferase [Actinoalloteichus caeruleus]|uniref:class I SAM-dependent methyltransferase n=1 Tax=Actinoalloteichus TaxID=65496 RepID=UPI0009DF166C